LAQELFQNLLLGGQMAAFGANPDVGHVADHRGHPAVGDGVNLIAVEAGKGKSALQRAGDHGIEVSASLSDSA
jgi:hypothetical protein